MQLSPKFATDFQTLASGLQPIANDPTSSHLDLPLRSRYRQVMETAGSIGGQNPESAGNNSGVIPRWVRNNSGQIPEEVPVFSGIFPRKLLNRRYRPMKFGRNGRSSEILRPALLAPCYRKRPVIHFGRVDGNNPNSTQGILGFNPI